MFCAPLRRYTQQKYAARTLHPKVGYQRVSNVKHELRGAWVPLAASTPSQLQLYARPFLQRGAQHQQPSSGHNLQQKQHDIVITQVAEKKPYW
jgi:hypothetical protein